MKLKVMTFLLMGFIAAAGCESESSTQPAGKVTPEDLKRDAGKLADTAAELARHAKDEFLQRLDAGLKDLDVEIAKLKEKGRDLKDEARVKWDQKLADLEGKREAARAKLAELTDSSKEASKDLQEGAQAAWEDLASAIKEAADEFQKSE